MNRTLLSGLLVLICVFALSTCGSSDETSSPPNVPTEPGFPVEPDAPDRPLIEPPGWPEIDDSLRESLSQVIDEYQSQVEQQESHLDALRNTASIYGDDQLSRLLNRVQEALTELQNRILRIQESDAGNLEALRSELRILSEEVRELFAQAQERLREIQNDWSSPA